MDVKLSFPVWLQFSVLDCVLKKGKLSLSDGHILLTGIHPICKGITMGIFHLFFTQAEGF